MSTTILRSIYGWSYQVDNVGTELALTVVIAYCLFAMVHIFYALISGISGSAWNSVAELVALAMNSNATTVLQNTCAGIIGVKAFRTNVQILETTEGHLEMCFDEGFGSRDSALKVKINEKYGRVADQEKEKWV